MSLEVWKIHRAEIQPIPNEHGEIMGMSLIGLVEIDGEIYRDAMVPVVDLDEAYAIKKWCDTKVDPYLLEVYEAEDEDYN